MDKTKGSKIITSTSKQAHQNLQTVNEPTQLFTHLKVNMFSKLSDLFDDSYFLGGTTTQHPWFSCSFI